MSNTYFQFKQFTVHQQDFAMKVCTDACLFGAYVAEKVVAKKCKAEHVLDIGTGTGLLSLMLAQTLIPATIEAIEINTSAALQAKENFELSPWSDKLTVINRDIKSFELTKRFELIISNPPFFENDLKSNDATKNTALHSSDLTLKDLLNVSKELLCAGGTFAVLLPFHRGDHFEKLATESGFFLQEKILVKQTENHSFFRMILLFNNTKVQMYETELAIQSNGKYSERFTTLLQPYYLYL